MATKRKPTKRGNKNQVTQYLTDDNYAFVERRKKDFGNNRNAYFNWLVKQDKDRLAFERVKQQRR